MPCLRVYSIRNAGDKKDLTVETGAYRYNRKRQGITRDIIERLLKLPHRFYQVQGTACCSHTAIYRAATQQPASPL